MLTRRAAVLVSVLIPACAKDEKPALSRAEQTPVPATSAAASEGSVRRRLPEPPLVDLSGRGRPVALARVSSGPRVYSRALRTWVHEGPSASSRRLGYLRAGASSPTAASPSGRAGCAGGWYPVEPRGFVCVGETATLDGRDPLVRATAEHRPDHLRKLPYIYGTVRKPGPVYARLPKATELSQAEPDLDERMQAWLDAEGEIGAGYAQEVWLGRPGAAAPNARALWTAKHDDALPWFLRDHASPPRFSPASEGSAAVLERMRAKVGHAFVQTVVHAGRRYGVTPELALLPTDRLRPIRGSDFHGVEIGKDIELPFAFVRRDDARFWVYDRAKRRLLDDGAAPYRAAVKLTGKQQFFRRRLHFETSDGKWLSDRDASRLDPARRMPAWGKNGEKWLDVNITKQTLMLYRGTQPVFATLISTGEAGLEDPEHTTATKRGIFRIHTKHVTATMSSSEAGEEFELREVPYVQYFDTLGYALHGAYWHDRFGVPKSHGCINLTPEDARRVFYFTEPQVPLGWHGALLPLRGTVMFVHP